MPTLLRSPAGRALVFAAAICAAAAAVAAESTAKPGHVEVSLLAERPAVVPGKPFWVGVRMRHDAHWHTYWRNPGDAGMPTAVAWRLPPEFRAGDIEWPYPRRIQQGPFASYGYEGEVLLPVPLFAPRRLAAGQDVALTAEVRWLECMENCVPQQATLTLRLAVAGATTPAKPAEAFRAARASLPQALAGAAAEAERHGDALEIRLRLPAGVGRQGDLFIEREDVVEPGVVPTLADRGDTVVWSSRLTPRGRSLQAPTLPAVWVAPGAAGRPQALRLDVVLKR